MSLAPNISVSASISKVKRAILLLKENAGRLIRDKHDWEELAGYLRKTGRPIRGYVITRNGCTFSSLTEKVDDCTSSSIFVPT